jgi:hypothetical protein
MKVYQSLFESSSDKEGIGEEEEEVSEGESYNESNTSN